MQPSDVDSFRRDKAPYIPLLGNFITLEWLMVAVLTPQSEIVFMNSAAKRAFLGAADTPTDGRSFHHFYRADVVQELTTLISSVLTTKRPHLYRCMRRGVGLEATLMPWSGAGDRADLVMLVAHTGRSAPPADQPPLPVVESRYVELGKLSILSPRELEVMAMLRRPLSMPQIAETLHRSGKTIDRHVSSVREKLNVHSRLEMLRMADAADLQIWHASSIRI